MGIMWIQLMLISLLLLYSEAVTVYSVFENVTQSGSELNSGLNFTEARQAGRYGLVRFEGDTDLNDNQQKYGFVHFENNPNYEFEYSPNISPDIGNSPPIAFEENQHRPQFDETSPGGFIKFEDNKDISNSGAGPATFQDDNSIEQKPVKKKKRRRRRKPRQQGPPEYPGQNYQNPALEYPGQQNAAGQYPGYGNPGVGYGYIQRPGNGYGNSRYPPKRQYRPPPRRPLVEDALSTITGAFSSIAQYDDLQCVPRILCEAAGGAAGGAAAGTGGGGAALLQGVTGLQPLLTLLSAYNGISTSPLFVFGRAVFLGMTSRGNAAICRYAYNQCPTDPEQLVHYLNNHNGGFFRFFSSPQRPGQQNLQQFYNQLSGTYGLQQDNGQNFGYVGADQGQGQNYGIFGQNTPVQGQGNFGLYQQNQQYSPGVNYAQNYDLNYSLGQNQYGFLQNVRRNENEIQDRIQTRPNVGYNDNEFGAVSDTGNYFKWSFPGDEYQEINKVNPVADRDGLKFPEQQNFRQPHVENYNYPVQDVKVFTFPQSQRQQSNTYNRYHVIHLNNNDLYNKNKDNYVKQNQYTASNNYANNNYASNSFANNKYAANSYVSNNSPNNRPYYNNDKGVTTVYIVRGNGDPNNPEIVNLRPGEALT